MPQPLVETDRKIIIAKPVPPSISSADVRQDEHKTILPLSLFTNQKHGPRRDKLGHILSYSLLGSAEDYEEFSQQQSRTKTKELPTVPVATEHILQNVESVENFIAESTVNLGSKETQYERGRVRFSSANQTKSRPTSASLAKAQPATSLGTHSHWPQNTVVVAVNRLYLETTVGEAAHANISIYNNSSRALTLEWQRVPTPKTLLGRYKPSAEPAVSRLTKIQSSVENRKALRQVLALEKTFFRQTRINLVSRERIDVPICLFSRHAGVFKEKWNLLVHPSVSGIVVGSEPSKIQTHFELTLDGAVLNPYHVQSSVERLSKEFEEKEKTAFMLSIVNDILDRKIRSAHEVALPLKRKLVTDDEDLFVQRNRDFNLQYSPQIFSAFSNMAKTVASLLKSDSIWDGSVMSIYNNISLIADNTAKSDLFAQWNQLLEQALSAPEVARARLSYVICYDMVVNLAHAVSSISESCRKQLGLPLARPCVEKFANSRSPFYAAASLGSSSNIDGADAGKAGVAGKKGGAASSQAPAGKGAPAAKTAAGKNDKGSSNDLRKSAIANTSNSNAVKMAAISRPASGALVDSSSDSQAGILKPRYSPEKARAESLYKQNFLGQVRASVLEHIARLGSLLEDASSK